MNRNADVSRYPSQQNRGNIPSLMKWNGCPSTIWVTKLFMRADLTDFCEAKHLQEPNHFPRFEDRDVSHLYPTFTV